MKWLPFKLTEQEKQALKEASNGKPFKLFQKEMLVYVVLLVLAMVLFWRQYNVLMLIIVVMAGVISVRYSVLLGANRANLSVANKVENELKKQQENALKFRPKILLFVVLPLLFLLIGIVFYVLYQQAQERNKINYGLVDIPSAENKLSEVLGETAGWQTYRNEDVGFEIKHPSDWGYDYRGTIETNPDWFISF
ncbi:hypothetical protein FJ208_00405 [Candidatus Gribaldobacteria bacterium]|nr:hypothetical protein [Candidatus Gribaldobacteria bacterium]